MTETAPSRPVVSIVIPIYNEQQLIEPLYSQLVPILDRASVDWEIVYVDDGSNDHSLASLLELQRDDPRISVIELTRNWGHQAALTAGLARATGDAVVLMDGDLQDPPEVVLDLIEAWQAGSQVVIAKRKSRTESGLRRFLMDSFYRVLGFLTDFPIPMNAGIFGLLDRQAARELVDLSERNRYLPGLRSYLGHKTAIVLYDRAARAGGDSKQGFVRLLRYGLDAIFSFSFKPLRLILFGGTTIASLGILYGVLLLTLRLLGTGMWGIPVVDGYTTTIVSVLFLGGVQLISVGILGEYIGRIYDEVKRRPLYLIQKVHQAETERER